MIKIYIIDKGVVTQERESTSLNGAKLQARKNVPNYCGCIILWDGEKVHKREFYRGKRVARTVRWNSRKIEVGFDKWFKRLLVEQQLRWAKHEQYFTGE